MTEAELDEWLSRPDDRVTAALNRLSGDVLILGAGGKMGPTLARMARRAMPSDRQVIAVSRFSSASSRAMLEQHDVITVPCDLLDRKAVERLPNADNIVFMAGQKFGTRDAPELTWMINTVLPSIVVERYAASRIVAFSTGCVYPLVAVNRGGSVETDELNPPGEYANSCLGRERVFSHGAKANGTRTLLFRLNYAIDLRYGVLHDIARKVWHDQPVDVTMGHVNFIWQGDANSRALQSLELADSPAVALNVTGRECLSVRDLARKIGELMRKPVRFTGVESDVAWLSNASQSFERFGDVSVPLSTMIQATAEWIMADGRSLGKPTHFEASDGRF
jgi:nucleoside-diphosphate-sugar epimerase